jgi:hypothetical protein
MGDSHLNWVDYRGAVGASVFIGGANWASHMATMSEVNARVQVLPWLGAGLSYFKLSVYSNESYAPLFVRALEVFGSAHPLLSRWVDPYVRVGAVRVVGADGGSDNESLTVGHWGMESMAGLNVSPGPVAFGVDIRHGFANRDWTLLGLHFEVRIPRW